MHAPSLAAASMISVLSPAVSLDDQIIVAIRRISQAVESYSRFLWQEYDLTAPQLGLLRELERREQSSPGQLAESLSLSPSTVAGILKRLKQRGLIVRRRSKSDRRSVTLRTSSKGRELAQRAPSLLRDHFREQLAALELWERTQLLAVLQRTAAMMNAVEIEHAPFFFHERPSRGGRKRRRNASSDGSSP